ncbi:hypothetical protein ACIQU2_06150 [Pseudomonas sp. NPDC098740]
MTALALTPSQAITMAFMQLGALAAITQVIFEVNLAMITATM